MWLYNLYCLVLSFKPPTILLNRHFPVQWSPSHGVNQWTSFWVQVSSYSSWLSEPLAAVFPLMDRDEQIKVYVQPLYSPKNCSFHFKHENCKVAICSMAVFERKSSNGLAKVTGPPAWSWLLLCWLFPLPVDCFSVDCHLSVGAKEIMIFEFHASEIGTVNKGLLSLLLDWLSESDQICHPKLLAPHCSTAADWGSGVSSEGSVSDGTAFAAADWGLAVGGGADRISAWQLLPLRRLNCEHHTSMWISMPAFSTGCCSKRAQKLETTEKLKCLLFLGSLPGEAPPKTAQPIVQVL